MGKIAEYRKKRSDIRRVDRRGVPEANWTAHYTPPLATDPKAGLVALRQYADPANVAHIAQRDMINYPYPPASFQVFVMNGWYGNQLPGTHKRPWIDPQVNPVNAIAHTQNHNPVGVQHHGSFGPQMSQKTAQGILSQVGKMWANVRNGNYGNT